MLAFPPLSCNVLSHHVTPPLLSPTCTNCCIVALHDLNLGEYARLLGCPDHSHQHPACYWQKEREAVAYHGMVGGKESGPVQPGLLGGTLNSSLEY